MDDEEQQDLQEPEAPEVWSGEPWPGVNPKQRAYLNALVFFAGHRRNAATGAKVSRQVVYYWLSTDPIFRAQHAIAQKQAFLVIEDEMIRRAYAGVLKGVYFQGEICGHERVYSDGLMMVLARAGDPKYRSSEVKHEGQVNLKFQGEMADLLALYRRTIGQDE